MRLPMQTFLSAVAMPFLLGMGACFLSTETERYSDGYGTGGSAGQAPCPTGGPGCPCTSQGACDPNLECVAMLNVCVLPDGCPTGDAGCECTAGGSCDEGFLCREGVCTSESPCLDDDIGTESCQCTAGGGCDVGLLCASGICVMPPDEETTTETAPTTDPTTDPTDDPTDASTTNDSESESESDPSTGSVDESSSGSSGGGETTTTG